MDVKSPPKRPMDVAKNTHASSASRREAESSMRFNEYDSMFKNECTRRVTHMERSDDEDVAPFFPGDARKMALN